VCHPGAGRGVRSAVWWMPNKRRTTKLCARAPRTRTRAAWSGKGRKAAASDIVVKQGAHTAAPALKEPLIKPRAVATAAFRDGMREARCSQWPVPLASRATKQTARKATVPQGCGKMRRLRRCAPRLRSPGYDLRRAPCILPHFASNAIRGGLNQRFLQLRLPCRGSPRPSGLRRLGGHLRRCSGLRYSG